MSVDLQAQHSAIAAHRRTHLRGDLRRVVFDGCAWAGMMGFGEHLFQAMVLSVALGERAAAMTAVIPAFLGSTAQLTTPWLALRLKSHRRVVLLGSWVQVLCLCILSMACVLMASRSIDRVPILGVLAVLSVYQWGGLAGGAAWTTWMGSVVPPQTRGSFFSMRTRWIYLVQLASLLAAGAVLAAADERRGLLWGFAIVMFIAAICRGASAVLLERTGEPVPVPVGHRKVMIPAIVLNIIATPTAGLIGCYLLVALAQNVAVPFLVPMTLGPLSEPAQVAPLVLGSMMLGRVGGFFLLPLMLRRYGTPGTWSIACVLLVPLFMLPAFWPTLVSVLIMQCVAGVAYAWWEMTTWLQVLERTPQGERTGSMSLLYFGTWLTSYIGGTLGAALLEAWRTTGDGTAHSGTVEPSSFALGGYQAVFFASSLARAAMLVPVWLWVKRSRHAA